MTSFVTIQKLSKSVGLDVSYIRKMIKNKVLTPHKIDGYKRIYIDINEFNSIVKPIDNNNDLISLDNFLV